jgi:hypothetical protein
VAGAHPEDILLLRCLLEATRKLQRQLARNDVDFRAVVFVRNDIYEHLLSATPDKGKDTAVELDWTDPEAFQDIVHRRIMVSTGQQHAFEQLWSTFFDTHVSGEESFSYLLSRTLMRPWDLLHLLRRCLNVAVNRGHSKVSESDILQAEKTYSEDQLQDVSFELRDISPDYPEVLYAFIDSAAVLTEAAVRERLAAAGVWSDQRERVLDLLLWFGFLGVLRPDGEERYAYQYKYGVGRMLRDVATPLRFVMHPAFRRALGCSAD